MLRSLYSAITGLRNHQTRMDVIGNNIANVNTVGYKSSRVVFQDLYSQSLQPATGGTATSAGTNPQQVGLGVAISSIDIMHTRAGSQYTGNMLDVAVEGDGFFIVSEDGNPANQLAYTRAGNMKIDSNGCLTVNGMFVMGYSLPLPTPPATPTLSPIDTSAYSHVSIDKNGVVKGLDASNNEVSFAQIQLATFNNQAGLEKAGSNLYTESANSGTRTIGAPNSGAAGSLNPGALEMSNVDLAQEFTDMITTQRGFQANSRVITVSDTLLEELVNLKR